jgi:hypothetical protein
MKESATVAASTYATAYLPRAEAQPSPMRLRRLRAGIRLVALAYESGFSVSTLSNLELGRRPVNAAEERTIAAALARIVARGRS